MSPSSKTSQSSKKVNKLQEDSFAEKMFMRSYVLCNTAKPTVKPSIKVRM